MSASVRIFCSYSHQDEAALDDLKAHLAEVRRQGLIDDWHDRRIQAGEDWAQSIDDALEAADLILLLVTKDFLASEYCNGIELKRGLERTAVKQARIVPVYLRPAYSKGAPFARFQGLPNDAKPVYAAEDPDAAWVEVVDGIVRAAREIRGEETPRQGLLASSPGLERPRKLPWIAVAVGLLLTLGFAGWWLLKPDDSRVAELLAKGDGYLNTGRYELALTAFNDVLTLEPEQDAADFGRRKAQLFAGLGPDFDVEAARTELSTLEKRHPDDAHIQVMLARLAAAAANTQEARRHYQRALELEPELAQA